jgi:hypothetical protein
MHNEELNNFSLRQMVLKRSNQEEMGWTCNKHGTDGNKQVYRIFVGKKVKGTDSLEDMDVTVKTMLERVLDK